MLFHNVDCLFVEGGLVGMTWECLYNDLLERGSHDNRLVLELTDFFLLDDEFGSDLRRVEGRFHSMFLCMRMFVLSLILGMFFIVGVIPPNS